MSGPLWENMCLAGNQCVLYACVWHGGWEGWGWIRIIKAVMNVSKGLRDEKQWFPPWRVFFFFQMSTRRNPSTHTGFPAILLNINNRGFSRCVIGGRRDGDTLSGKWSTNVKVYPTSLWIMGNYCSDFLKIQIMTRFMPPLCLISRHRVKVRYPLYLRSSERFWGWFLWFVRTFLFRTAKSRNSPLFIKKWVCALYFRVWVSPSWRPLEWWRTVRTLYSHHGWVEDAMCLWIPPPPPRLTLGY